MNTSTKILRNLYTFVFFIAIPAVLMRLLIRSRKQPNYRRHLKERFGLVRPTEKPSIWIHSVSVGETIATMPLITQLLTEYPEHTLYITTTTPTGRAQIHQHLSTNVRYSYIPYDIPLFLNHFIRCIKPRVSVMMETEVWPNVLWVCKKNNIPILLANARLSYKSYCGYARLKTAANDLFNLFTQIAAQSDLDAQHFRLLGVDAHKIITTGSIKFDRDIPTTITQQATQRRQQWQLTQRPIIIAASTREGEEVYVLDAYKKIKTTHPDAFLILVPRHPERINAIAKQCSTAGLTFTRTSEQRTDIANHDIVLGDTIGELLLLYAIADMAYVGGSLVDMGCHNVLEPAALSMPIITGPYLRNFKTICAMLQDAKAQCVVHNADELASTIQQLLDHPEQMNAMGQRAQQVYQRNKGATQKHVAMIRELLCHAMTH